MEKKGNMAELRVRTLENHSEKHRQQSNDSTEATLGIDREGTRAGPGRDQGGTREEDQGGIRAGSGQDKGGVGSFLDELNHLFYGGRET